ncbi:MAG TPA: hypothetical protein VE955_12580 [Candidatus Dormibacteraeota bacterium]|nr:hypothetical protein [Candidatus Dormibacteraeota bacterium]
MASQWFAIRSIPSEVIDLPTNLCIFSLCYTEALWTWILLGTVFVAAPATVVVLRIRLGKRHVHHDHGHH